MTTTTYTDMIGMTFAKVEGTKGTDILKFTTADGCEFIFYHQQDCCEDVRIEDIVGDLDDLCGTPIVGATETVQECPWQDAIGTWTFYRFSTVKGTVTVRWLGESNGFYSESVDFKIVPPAKPSADIILNAGGHVHVRRAFYDIHDEDDLRNLLQFVWDEGYATCAEDIYSHDNSHSNPYKSSSGD